jgi:hypothetical protein
MAIAAMWHNINQWEDFPNALKQDPQVQRALTEVLSDKFRKKEIEYSNLPSHFQEMTAVAFLVYYIDPNNWDLFSTAVKQNLEAYPRFTQLIQQRETVRLRNAVRLLGGLRDAVHMLGG